jgi:hypothetical protein
MEEKGRKSSKKSGIRGMSMDKRTREYRLIMWKEEENKTVIENGRQRTHERHLYILSIYFI